MASQAADFGFIFEDSSCFDEVLDSIEGTFTTTVTNDPLRRVTVPMPLTDRQIRAVYEKLVSIRFWSYPANFAVPLSSSGQAHYQFPVSHFRITVHNAGVERSVDWLIQYVEPTNRDAENLLSLISLIIDMIRSSPAQEMIPERGFGCA